MNNIQTIAKNTFVLLISVAISYFLGFIFIMYSARYLGAENFGILSFALALNLLLMAFTDLGVSKLMVREVSRNRAVAPTYINNIIFMKILLGLIVFFIVFAITNIFNYPTATKNVLFIMTFSIIINSFINMFNGVFQAYEKMEYISLAGILKEAFMVSGAFFLIQMGLDLTAFALLYLAGSIVCLAFVYSICLKKFFVPGIAINFDFWRSTIFTAIPFSITVIIGGIFFNVDLVMISAIKDDVNVGWYKAAVSIALVVSTAAIAFTDAIFPLMSKLFVSAKNVLKMTVEKSTKYLLIVSLPTSVGIFSLSEKFVTIIFGHEFLAASLSLKILSIYLPFRVISHVTGWTLASIDKEPLRTMSASATLGINIILNFSLIPLIGIEGAALSTLISQIILFTFYLYFVRQHLHGIPVHQLVLKPAIGCVPMYIFLTVFSSLSVLLLVPGSIIIYFTVLWILGGFDQQDKRILKIILQPIDYLFRKDKAKLVQEGKP